VVNAEEVEEVGELSDAAFPPLVFVFGNGVPVVVWDTPVLSPFDGEFVVFEEFFWGSAAKWRRVFH